MTINELTAQWASTRRHVCEFKSEVTSTNDWAKNDFSSKQSRFAIFLTNHQTHGRGRNQRQWTESNPGQCLLSTWCYSKNFTPQPILTPLLGEALLNTLLNIQSDLPIELKPPNDLLLNHKKLSGLLVEIIQQGNKTDIMVGLGMNIHSAPQVDQPTAALNEAMNIHNQTWMKFCDELHLAFDHAIEKSRDSKLSDRDQKRVLIALNRRQPGRYTGISASGDLQNQNGWISWMDL